MCDTVCYLIKQFLCHIKKSIKIKKKEETTKSICRFQVRCHIIDVERPMTADAVGNASLLSKNARIEQALGGGVGHQRGYAPGAENPEAATNRRKGISGKMQLTDDVSLSIGIGRSAMSQFAIPYRYRFMRPQA